MTITIKPELARFAEDLSGDELNKLISIGKAEADRGELLDGDEVFAEIRRLGAARRAESKSHE